MKLTNKTTLETRTLRKLLTCVKNKIGTEEGRKRVNEAWKVLRVEVRQDSVLGLQAFDPYTKAGILFMRIKGKNPPSVVPRRVAAAFEHAFLRHSLKLQPMGLNSEHPEWNFIEKRFGLELPLAEKAIKEKTPPTPLEVAEKKLIRAQRMLHRWQLRATRAQGRVLSWTKRANAAHAAALRARAAVPKIGSEGIERRVGKRHIKLQEEGQ